MPEGLVSALGRIYGDDTQVLQGQVQRYRRDLAAFAAQYGSGPVTVHHSPGRVNLIGEHTDYNHGYVLPMALDKDVLLLARPRADGQVNLLNLELTFRQRSFLISSDIRHRPVGDWSNYLQGPAEYLERTQGPGLLGLDALVDGASPHGVPRGAGLSSSSALTVVSAVALVLRNDVKLGGALLAEACGRAEWYVGTRGGIMDQFIAILAQRDHALFLDCRPAEDGSGYRYRQVPIPRDYAVIVVDSGVRHRNTGPHFNRRVAEGRIGVRLLQRAFTASPGQTITHLRDVDHIPWAELEPLLPEVVYADELRASGIDPDLILDRGVSAQTDTFFVRRRCRHVLTENKRVLQSVSALENGDVATFGRLMAEAHASARDDYEISTPEIETLVGLACDTPGTIGARLTGAGWGGCIVAVVQHDAVSTFRDTVTTGYRRKVGREAHVFVCRSATGAGAVWETTV